MSVWNKIKGALIVDESKGMPDPAAVAPPQLAYSAMQASAGAPAAYHPQPPPVAQPPFTAEPIPAPRVPSPPNVSVSPTYAPPIPILPTPAPLIVDLGAQTPRLPAVGLSAPVSPVMGTTISPATSPRISPLSTSVPTSVNMEQIAAIYQEAGIAQSHYTAEQALRFLSTLPVDQVAASRRAALLGLVDSLRDTFPGMTSETLAEDARSKVEALEQTGHVRAGKFTKFEEDREREIENLREQIQQRQVAVEARRVQDQQLTLQCAEHAERLKKLIAVLFPQGGA